LYYGTDRVVALRVMNLGFREAVMVVGKAAKEQGELA
jgi:hypothetical protein